MIKYSIVIPTYGRPQYLKKCLASIDIQSIKPQDVFVIDNNVSPEMRRIVQEIVQNYHSKKINYTYTKGVINSGAVARNHGASLVSTELVAFLDDDVVLDIDYYENVLNVFETDDQVAGVQGLDRALIGQYQLIARNYLRRLGLFVANYLEIGTIIKGTNSELSPSLSVTHPVPDCDFLVESQWISTCAGVFKTDLFNVIEFPKNFVKYSWNEYVFFSHSIYKKKLGTMIYTSAAKHRNIPTDSGRLPVKELVYMAEVYDLYIFSQLFDRSLSEKLIYIKSRMGIFLFYLARMVYRRDFDWSVLSNILSAWRLAYSNRDKIRQGNFDCYNKRFPLE